MENTARYTVIGLFTLGCVVAGFAFVYWIKNVGGLGARVLYDVRYEHSVSGLTEGASVLFNGVRAGAVTKIVLDPDNPKRVTATISLDPRTPVRADTQVDITYIGLTGVAAVALIGGTREAPLLTPQNGQTPLLVASAGTGRTLTESAQVALRNIDELVSQNSKGITTAVNGIATFADMLGRNSERVEGVLTGLEKLTGGGGSAKGPNIYDLAAAGDFPAAGKEIKAQLVVPDPSALILFDSQKILTRSAAGTYGNINNAQWADNLPKLVQARLVQSFEKAQQLNKVSRPLDSLNPEYKLETTIGSFHLVTEPAPQAVIELTARLVSEKGDVAAARVFSVSVPAKSAEAADAVAAFNQAFAKLAKDIVSWTIETL